MKTKRVGLGMNFALAECHIIKSEGTMRNITRRKLIMTSFGATVLLSAKNALSGNIPSAGILMHSKKNTHKSALIIVDMQNDFLPGGALPVKNGNEIIPIINSLYDKFEHIILTQDWHPIGHVSFSSSHENKKPFDTTNTSYGPQVLWPDHCVQGSNGAQISSELKVDKVQLIIRKGYNMNLDSYSAFEEADHSTLTGLSGYLKERKIDTLYIVGLATDFCVGWTAMDAVKHGFTVSVIEDATKGIDFDNSLQKGWLNMRKKGVKRVNSKDII